VFQTIPDEIIPFRAPTHQMGHFEKIPVTPDRIGFLCSFIAQCIQPFRHVGDLRFSKDGRLQQGLDLEADDALRNRSNSFVKFSTTLAEFSDDRKKGKSSNTENGHSRQTRKVG
jgi:hypothetical protein